MLYQPLGMLRFSDNPLIMPELSKYFVVFCGGCFSTAYSWLALEENISFSEVEEFYIYQSNYYEWIQKIQAFNSICPQKGERTMR